MFFLIAYFDASAQHSVAGGITVLFSSSMCVSVHPCVIPETLLTRYFAEYLTHFYETYVSEALCDTIWGQEVKVHGHGE